MRHLPPRQQGALAGELDDICNLPIDDLKTKWLDLYGVAPPSRFSRNLLTLGIAWKRQAQVLGGLKPATMRWLAQIGEGRSPPERAYIPKPGTRLLRDWHGVTHEAILQEEGVLYRSTVWPSLSAVAREITGARWSGPRFFGLKGKQDAG